MTRMQKNQEAKERRKRLIYPIIAFVIGTMVLLAVVDYRINNTFGTGRIRIVGAQIQNDRITLSVFNKRAVSANFEFLKRDMMRLQNGIFKYVNEFENLTREVFKQYWNL